MAAHLSSSFFARPPPPKAFIALLRHGACVDVTNGSGHTPLHTAAVHEFSESVQALLERGAGKHEPTDQGRPPLSLAAELGLPHVAEVLLGAGADMKNLAVDEPSAVSLAAAHGHSEVLDVLIRHGADLNTKHADGDTPLHEAARWIDAGAIDAAIKAGACIEALDANGWTPLLVAFRSAMVRCQKDGNFCGLERFSAMTALLKHGANVNKAETYKNFMLLHFSAQNGCPLHVFHALLAAGPDLEVRDDMDARRFIWRKTTPTYWKRCCRMGRTRVRKTRSATRRCTGLLKAAAWSRSTPSSAPALQLVPRTNAARHLSSQPPGTAGPAPCKPSFGGRRRQDSAASSGV